MLEVQKILADFSTDRPTLDANNSVDRLIGLLLGEVDEFKESQAPDELADVAIFVVSLANRIGIDLEAEMRKKIAYNHARYNAIDFQSGSYEEARKRGKAREAEVKPIFYPIDENVIG